MKRSGLRVVLLVGTCLLLGVGAVPPRRAVVGAAPTTNYDTHKHSLSHTLRVKINGRTHPHLIPDAIAYQHLIMATAASDTEPPNVRRFRETVVKRIGLSPLDERRYVETLRSLHVRGELARIQQERTALNHAAVRRQPTMAKALNRLLSEERTLLRRAKDDVIVSISHKGALVLDHYVQTTTKRQINILSGSHPHVDED